MNRPFPQKKNEKRINDAIIARELMVISDAWEPLGKMTRDAALTLAGSQDLDLVEVGMQDGLPLTKIIDYGKFVFKQQKQQSQNKSNTKKTELKTMKLTYKIGDHDLDVRRNQAERIRGSRYSKNPRICCFNGRVLQKRWKIKSTQTRKYIQSRSLPKKIIITFILYEVENSLRCKKTCKNQWNW